MSSARKKSKIKLIIPLTALLVMGVLGFQLFGLYTKLAGYKEREAALTRELEGARERSRELADYEAYTLTDEYIMNVARTKLGLVKENEIIFKEK